MWRIFGGALLVIAGIAAFIEAHSHRPIHVCIGGSEGPCNSARLEPGNLGQTAYDLLRVGAWALVIVGGLLVVTGLIRYWARQAR